MKSSLLVFCRKFYH